MRLKFNFSKGVTNRHGTQKKGEPWNQQTVRGPLLTVVDLLGPILKRQQENPEGGRTSAVWYKRFVYYFRDGSCWYFDFALVKRPR